MPPLDALVDAGHDVRIVVTQSDKRRGRGAATSPSPVKAAAQRLGLRVSHRVVDTVDSGAELGVVVAFGRLIQPDVLARVPMINVHFSLLPRWRGAAPVERAILAGDTVTGACIMQLEEGLDTGPVYACEAIDIGAEETAAALRARLTEVGTRLLVDLLRGPLPAPTPQTGDTVYAEKITSSDLRINWARPANEVLRVVRVGRAWTTFRGKRLQVLDATPAPEPPRDGLDPGAIDGHVVACGRGAVALVAVKPEGRAAQPATAWANGAHLRPDERLGE